MKEKPKEYDPKEFQRMFTEMYPVRAKILTYIAKFFVMGIYTLFLIILLSVAFICVSLLVYAVKLSVGVWI